MPKSGDKFRIKFRRDKTKTLKHQYTPKPKQNQQTYHHSIKISGSSIVSPWQQNKWQLYSISMPSKTVAVV